MTTPNPGGLFNLALGFMASRTFLTAVEMGVFGALADGPKSIEALQGTLGLHPRGARDFLDGLVALKVLARDEAGLYANTPEGALFLDPAKPSYIGGIFEMTSRRLYGHWERLPAALRTGEFQNEARFGDDVFAQLYSDPERLEVFLAGMTGVSRGPAMAIAEHFPWKNYKTFADCGAAQGVVPVTLAQAHPHLKGIGFDLPQVKPVFEKFVAKNGLTDRLTFQAGSFFTDKLPKADVLVMGHILHDWDLKQKKFLVKAAYDALDPGGVFLAYDMMIDDARRENVAGLMMSLNMLVETQGGFDYTGADSREWFKDAGFKDVKTTPISPTHSMTVGTK